MAAQAALKAGLEGSFGITNLAGGGKSQSTLSSQEFRLAQCGGRRRSLAARCSLGIEKPSKSPQGPAKPYIKEQVSFLCQASTGGYAAPRDTLNPPDKTISLDNSSGGGLGDGGNGKGYGGRGGGGGRGDSDSGNGSGASSSGSHEGSGVLGIIAKGWQDRVDADPQFVFKVLTEQIIGVTACVLGDMASRPNFGLNELDFVFCTLVVGSIVNFALMYLLAPTAAEGLDSENLPGIFARSPSGYMFEAGSYSLLDRLGTFVYKGLQFATVGFGAGLAGTALSNALLTVRKNLQPNFILQNKPPPTFLNAATWALHMGFSSNLRYQCLNGLDQVLLKSLSPNVFRGLSFFIRGANNVIGGSTFVTLAKLTGSQKAGSSAPDAAANAEGKEEAGEPGPVKPATAAA